MIPLLIVDDESIIRETIAAMLRRKYPDQFHIFLASNGQEALSLVASENVELVLADIKMPVMDGIAATQAIRGLDRADAATVPILAMTANAFAEDIERSRKAGMNEHLAKPIEPETLYARLASYFR